MWWRLGLLAAVTAAVLLCLFTPIAPVRITVRLPPVADRRAAEAEVKRLDMPALRWIVDGAAVGGVLAVSGWIGWRIVRRHRRPPSAGPGASAKAPPRRP